MTPDDEGARRDAAGVVIPNVTTSLRALPDAAGAVRGLLLEFAGAHGAGHELLGDISSAVTEAVGNVVLHAYDGQPGLVYVDADIEDGDLEIVVADDGDGFRPGGSPGLGAGLNLIAERSSAFGIRSRAPLGGTEVWMRFHLDA